MIGYDIKTESNQKITFFIYIKSKPNQNSEKLKNAVWSGSVQPIMIFFCLVLVLSITLSG